jgi:hypothetical protein
MNQQYFQPWILCMQPRYYYYGIPQPTVQPQIIKI